MLSWITTESNYEFEYFRTRFKGKNWAKRLIARASPLGAQLRQPSNRIKSSARITEAFNRLRAHRLQPAAIRFVDDEVENVTVRAPSRL